MAARTFGTVSPEQFKAMNALAFVQGLASGVLPLNTIARTLGYEVVEADPGRVVIAAQPTQEHLNPWGTVHGVSRRRCSIAAWGWRCKRCSKTASAARRWNSRFRSFAPITPQTGRILAEGTLLNCGRRVGTAEDRVTDPAGRLLAHGTTSCLIFPL